MARKARVEFEGAVYHVLDSGDRREAIFKDDADRRRFLETLGEACVGTGWRWRRGQSVNLALEAGQRRSIGGR